MSVSVARSIAPLSAIAALAACIPLFPSAHAAVVLTYDVSSESQPLPGSSAKPAQETYPLTATLGHDYLTVEHHGTRLVYELDKHRLLEINLADRTYVDHSLFEDIGFRVIELQNRLTINAALAAAKVQQAPTPPALVEHLFSLTSEKEHTVLEEKHRHNEQIFTWQGHELMAVSDTLLPLPAGYQAEYWRFLRYYAGGHPAIYTSLAKLNGAPATLRIVITNASIETRTLHLMRVQETNEVPPSISDFHPKPSPSDEPYPTLSRLGADAPSIITTRSADAVRARDAETEQHHYLDALLSQLEANLETGDRGIDWLSSHRDPLAADEDSRKLMASLQPRSPQEAETAVQTLEALRTSAPDRRYVINVFEGNVLGQLRKPAEGEAHLLTALHTNPYLISAWFDLGGFYYSTFQLQKAWACWDAARAAHPTHPFRSGPDNFEQRVMKEHPEFF
jgi:hypothetical protein